MFGKKLEEIMKEKKIKVKELSIAADITEGFISDIRKGRSLPSVDKLARIMENLDLSEKEELELYEEWEKSSSPISFTEKYEKLKTENKKIKELLVYFSSEKQLENIVLENEKLKLENMELSIYKKMFLLLPKEDCMSLMKIIMKDIEYTMKDEGIFEENKNEIYEIREILSKDLNIIFDKKDK